MSSSSNIGSVITEPGFFNELVDTIPTGVVVTNTAGHIIYINAETERLFGYLRHELIGESIDTLLPDRFSRHHAALRHSYLQNPTTRHMGAGRDLYGKRKNGTEFPLEVGLRPLFNRGEHWIIATIVDISGRKQLEAKFAKVIEASPYGQLLVDQRGIIQLVNPSLCTLFGYTEEELLGHSMNILLPERYREGHDHLRDTYQHQPSLRAMGVGRDLTGRHKNGTEIPVEIGLSPVETEKGQYTLAVITDITERKRLQLSLQQANAHMEEFTYVASHDLKSPLRGIADLVEWLSEDLPTGLSESIYKNIDRIKLRIDRMEKLVDDLLLYARAGKRAKDASPIAVEELIHAILDVQPIPESFQVSINIMLHQLIASRTPLETVLRNLISNAIKHHDGKQTDGCPSIQIHVEASGNFALFRIRDNGPGIPETAQERIFRLFQTLSHTDSSSGIGLAVAKRMAESHGGHIQVISHRGERGAEFRVYWPRFPRKEFVE
ncbi:sensor histidine kinase [Cellvibrio japonicus]|uniref:histidine kinase n=1 Tax=Cellvibrio japonicus (strain Ueda107) TaxID=498211 RepID=B3PKH6_CELJU|nr:PAS domain S-box protein [Cellvibrio japonicus]ACE86084.1 histidine kinase sensor protein [Cellvibrio japonicus Ueda107]QEI12842.1 PAS domain S-box protein [Cellvibrio japonicus]QEI16416.1 PAS domain S-box protein [Cellvibrio japonicus]QEI19994.1 PAS domain S-box protein [Cellvibrio japonicus]